MRVDCALLCDAVTVRDGLLHILGGGITRLHRPSFPTHLGVSLALRVMVHPTESDREHQIETRLLAEDGAELGRVEIGFGITAQDVRPGEELSAPFAIPLIPVALPSEGSYSFELLIDGVHQASVPFTALLAPTEPEAFPGTPVPPP